MVFRSKKFHLAMKLSQEIINNFSLHLKKGNIISITGESGSGKSTLLDLIMGLLEIQNLDLYFMMVN